jgi:hypothetical protein
MQSKLKVCYKCNQEKIIWKNDAGKRYCKDCWYQVKPVTKTITSKTPIKPISDKQQKINVVYSLARKEFLSRKNNQCCEAKITQECTGCRSEYLTIHHSKGRHKYMLDTTTWKVLCLSCHTYIETHPDEARTLGFTETRI